MILHLVLLTVLVASAAATGFRGFKKPGDACVAAPQGNVSRRAWATVGDFKATLIDDGTLHVPEADAPFAAPLTKIERLMEHPCTRPPLCLLTLEVKVLYLERDTDKILIDAGKGSIAALENPGGALITELAAMCVKPEDITHVLLSHAHWDHIGGLVENGTSLSGKAFPNAEVYISEPELEHWTADLPRKSIYYPFSAFNAVTGIARRIIELYQDQIVTFKLGHEVLPGIISVPVRWHTPGASAFQFGGTSGPFSTDADMFHVQVSSWGDKQNLLFYLLAGKRYSGQTWATNLTIDRL